MFNDNYINVVEAKHSTPLSALLSVIMIFMGLYFFTFVLLAALICNWKLDAVNYGQTPAVQRLIWLYKYSPRVMYEHMLYILINEQG